MHQRYDCVRFGCWVPWMKRGRIGSSCRAGVAFCREALFAPEGSRRLLETAEQRGSDRWVAEIRRTACCICLGCPRHMQSYGEEEP